MAKEKTTADKKNAYKIYWRMNQAIFRELIEHQGDDVFKYHKFALFDRSALSSLAIVATKAIMNDPRFYVVLRKG